MKYKGVIKSAKQYARAHGCKLVDAIPFVIPKAGHKVLRNGGVVINLGMKQGALSKITGRLSK